MLFEKEGVAIDSDYKTRQRVKRRPPLLTGKFGSKAVLWRDEAHRQIGVSAGNCCNIFPLSGIESVEIYRVLPARGGGNDFLNVRYKTDPHRTEILSVADYYLDSHRDVLEKFFGMPIEE
ncbi:MAG: hypothetical protein Q4A62_04395 [Eikenella sp.]|nr:hypothetical protein [Eikenella sp.]